MIKITLKDSQGNELSLNDIVIVHNPNPLMKYLGRLVFDPDYLSFIISDMNGKYESFTNSIKWKTYERIAPYYERQDLRQHFGNLLIEKNEPIDWIYNKEIKRGYATQAIPGSGN